MKRSLIYIIAFFYSFSADANDFNIQYIKVSETPTKIVYDIYITFSQIGGTLGSSNIVSEFDQGLTNPILVSSNSALVPFFYQNPTLTQPRPNIVSLNIELSFANFGALQIEQTPNCTFLARIEFDIIDETLGKDISLEYDANSTSSTVIFLGDETTRPLRNLNLTTCSNVSSPLPLELLEFNTEKQEYDILLTWKSGQEINIKEIQILRSSDFITLQSSPEILAVLSPQGSNSDYSYSDNRVPKNQDWYYKLKIIDEDGSYEYSNTCTSRIDFHIDNTFSIFPNPNNGLFEIMWERNEETSYMTCSMHTADGKELKFWEFSNVEHATIDISDYPSGIYFFYISNDYFTSIERIIKQ